MRLCKALRELQASTALLLEGLGTQNACTSSWARHKPCRRAPGGQAS